MDRKNISIGGGANKVEFCDIALADRTLVHAKKRSSSSTLSHLWSQGTVAMDALLGDQDFREAVRAKMHQLGPAFEDIAAEGLSGTDYQVVYLIIGVDTGEPTWKSLPFFSQVALAQAARTLGSMGVRVALSGVPSVWRCRHCRRSMSEVAQSLALRHELARRRSCGEIPKNRAGPPSVLLTLSSPRAAQLSSTC